MNINSIKKKFRNIKTLFFLGTVSLPSFAQRVSCEDIYGDCSGGGDGGIFGTIGLIIFVGFIIWGFITNKGFRLGVLAYAGFLGGLIFVFKAFGKEAGIAACIVAIIILWFMDPSNSDKN